MTKSVRELSESRAPGSAGIPAWMSETEEALQKLLSLPANWDSYGARPIVPEIVRSAIDLLRQVARAETPQPTVVPTVRGGVQIEWHIHGIWLEIELLSPERVGILYEDRQKGAEEVSTPTPKTQHPTPKDVDRLCEALFLTHTAKEGDDNLALVRNRLLKSEADLASLLDLYGKLRAGREVADDETNALCGVLKLSGVAKVESGRLVVRNRIYGQVFDRGWVAQHMPDAEVRRQREAYRRGVLRTATVAALVVALVAGLAVTAGQQARRAEEGQRTLRRHLYVAQMNVAQQAWNDGNVEQAQELLQAQRPGQGQEDLRGFEWRYLWRLCRQKGELFTLPGPRGAVRAVAFSPDGKFLAFSTHDGAVKLWDRASRREVATLARLNDQVVRMGFLPDGKTVITVSFNSRGATVRGWDVARRREVALRSDARGPFVVVRGPSLDGKILITRSGSHITRSGSHTVRVWDLKARREMVSLTGLPNLYGQMALSPDGRILAARGADPTVQLWDITTKRAVATLKGHAIGPHLCSFSPDGKILATASDDTTVRLWDLATKRALATLRGHRAGIYALAFSHDGKTLATGSIDSTVKLWDLAAQEPMTTFRGHSGVIISVKFSPDDKTLATVSDNDGAIKLWDASVKRETDILLGHHPGPLAFSPDGKILATGDGEGAVKLWNPATKLEIAYLKGHTAMVSNVAFSPDGRTLASAGHDHSVRLWDIASRREVAMLKGHTGPVLSVAFSPDGRRFATGSGVGLQAGELKLWDVPSATRGSRVLAAERTAAGAGPRGASEHAREPATLRRHQRGGCRVAFSPDGRLLATRGNPGTVTLWDVGTKRAVAALRGETEGVRSMVFSPDGKLLATGGGDKTVKLWDVQRALTNQGLPEVATLKGHAGVVQSVAFSPDGKILVSGSYDTTIKLWNVAMKQEVASLKGHTGPVGGVAFSPDGNTLASAGLDRTVRLWRAAPLTETDAPSAR